jgi:adenylate kinase
MAESFSLYGRPGAGKDTTLEAIRKMLPSVVMISPGDLARDARTLHQNGHPSPLYPIFEPHYPSMDAGELMPAQVIVEAMKEATRITAYKSRWICFNGFPRSAQQLEGLHQIVNPLIGSGLISQHRHIEIRVSEKEALKRIAGRATSKLRGDDQEEIARKRQEVFAQQTAPVIDHLEAQGQLIVVDGEQSRRDVFKDTLRVVLSEQIPEVTRTASKIEDKSQLIFATRIRESLNRLRRVRLFKGVSSQPVAAEIA